MRKFIMTLGVSTLLMTNVCAQGITLNINNQIVEAGVAPVQEDGVTLVPLRIISENLGAIVGWDKGTQTILLTKEDTQIKLVIGSKIMSVNGEEQEILLAPRLIQGTTMVPIRVISENLDGQVTWDSENNQVLVSSEGGEKPSQNKGERYITTITEMIDDQEAIYEGEVILQGGKEVFDGYGEWRLEDGSYYNGEFRNGEFNGEGILSASYGMVWEGNFKDGELHGQGKYSVGEFISYEGEFKNGKADGYGKMTTFDDGEIDAVIEGEFKDDDPEGKITMTYSDGGIAKGVQENGIFTGELQGVPFSDGVYSGWMEKGVFTGTVTVTHPGGKTEEIEVKDDVAILK